MSRLTFFRQSGWMMIATLVAAAFSWAVHLVAPGPLGKGAYGLFNTLITVLGFMGIPALGVQAILAQQTAGAVTESQRRQLRGTVRLLLAATFVLWAVAAVGGFFLQDYLMTALKIKEPATLWVTVLTGLFLLWAPVFSGVLQGEQNFLWFGLAGISGLLGRFVGIVIIVCVLGYGITGAISSVLMGVVLALLISAWHTHGIWRGPSERIIWKDWLGRALPLSIGIGTSIFIMNADMILVRKVFEEDETGLYSAAGILGRALAYFTGPITQVMFPKVVQSAARAERTNVVVQAAGATALFGGIGAVVCTIAPWLPLKIIYPPEYLVIEPLVPWFAWCVLPLTLSNVLINNLLARERFQVVVWLVAIALGYGTALFLISGHLDTGASLPIASFRKVVILLGLFSLALLTISAWFTWKTTQHGHGGQTAAAAT